MRHVAVLGTGKMGAGIARSLLRSGLDVSVWNRSPGRAAPLAADGAHWPGRRLRPSPGLMRWSRCCGRQLGGRGDLSADSEQILMGHKPSGLQPAIATGRSVVSSPATAGRGFPLCVRIR